MTTRSPQGRRTPVPATPTAPCACGRYELLATARGYRGVVSRGLFDTMDRHREAKCVSLAGTRVIKVLGVK